MITVLGALADTREYLGQPGYNVSPESDDWTPEKGFAWLKEAIVREDQFLLVSNHDTFGGFYMQELFFLVGSFVGTNDTPTL